MTMFAVIYEVADDGSWHARAADLPVFSCGDSRAEAEEEVKAGIALYLEELASMGQTVLPTANDAGMVSVELPSVVAQ